ncbi:glycosyltransferase [Flaviramulus aquimarinus]|uniref:Glycosyltransferase n=1 Tax=Flaviramulus aquimarinus TaxID=1170456 RepID=A0ABP9EQV6_9FLAO
MDELVSIIVPCYNQAKFLEETLQSVMDQTYTNWECIIVNDGSTDNTEAVSLRWCKLDERFKYLSKANGGPSTARNEAIKISKGNFILPLDADDYISKNYLNKLLPELQNNKSLGIISCYTKFFSDDINKATYELKPKGTNWKNLLYVNQLIVTSLYRKECWQEVGGYDEAMKEGFEDWEFWIAVTKRGWNYKVMDSFLFFYRKAKISRQTDAIKHHFENSKTYIFTKHKELYVEDFDNFIKVLLYDIKTHRTETMKIKNSFEYKLGKLMTKPFRAIRNLLLKQE